MVLRSKQLLLVLIISRVSNMSNKEMHDTNKTDGFTLVEMLVVAPIVILVIGAFVSAIIFMTGNILATRSSGKLQYSVQDALNSIERDASLSSSYLATNNLVIQSPQGYNNDTTAFHNADAVNGTALILNSYATTSSPLSSTQDFIYKSSPNACNSGIANQNPKLMFNVVYFVKNNILWRRIVAPADYLTSGCSAPWQQPSCAPGQTGSYCLVQDEKLVEGVSAANGFIVSYYDTPSSANSNTTASDSTQSDSVRQAILDKVGTIDVKISATSTVAGRSISQTASSRASTSPNIEASP